MINKFKDKISQEGLAAKKEIQQKTIGYILTAFGLVAGLAWNEAIKSLIEYLMPMNAGTILAKLIYALVMTALVVVVSLVFMRIFGKATK